MGKVIKSTIHSFWLLIKRLLENFIIALGLEGLHSNDCRGACSKKAAICAPLDYRA